MISACIGQGMLLGWMRPGSRGVFSQAGYLQNAAAAALTNPPSIASRTIRLTGTHQNNWVKLAQDRGSLKDAVHGLAIEIGADGAEESCARCERDSTANWPLCVCDTHSCTAAWHAHCLPAYARQLLVLDRWFCPNRESLQKSILSSMGLIIR